jgi:hypothetical protein
MGKLKRAGKPIITPLSIKIMTVNKMIDEHALSAVAFN